MSCKHFSGDCWRVLMYYVVHALCFIIKHVWNEVDLIHQEHLRIELRQFTHTRILWGCHQSHWMHSKPTWCGFIVHSVRLRGWWVSPCFQMKNTQSILLRCLITYLRHVVYWRCSMEVVITNIHPLLCWLFSRVLFSLVFFCRKLLRKREKFSASFARSTGIRIVIC